MKKFFVGIDFSKRRMDVSIVEKDFPEQGKEGILYVDGNSLYRWNDATQNYSQIGAGGETLNWGAII